MVQLPTAAYYLLIQATTDNVVTNDSSTDIVSFAYVVIIDKHWPYARSFIESINSFMKSSRIATLIILRHQYVLHYPSANHCASFSVTLKEGFTRLPDRTVFLIASIASVITLSLTSASTLATSYVVAAKTCMLNTNTLSLSMSYVNCAHFIRHVGEVHCWRGALLEEVL